MKLPVPFFKQTTPLNCGPAALRMILAYLDKDPGIEILEEKTGIKEGKGTNTIQLANATATIGFKTKLFTLHLSYNEENKDLNFNKQYDDMTQDKFKVWLQKAKDLGVEMQEKSISQEKLLSFVTESSLPIVLLDFNVIRNKEGYHGHFAPIVGYDEENIYIHNHGMKDTQEFMPVKRDLFDKARKAKGTDEDVVVVYKKSA
ncbi:MAG: peptidase C39 family protein [Nanoarchaeota archaeon]